MEPGGPYFIYRSGRQFPAFCRSPLPFPVGELRACPSVRRTPPLQSRQRLMWMEEPPLPDRTSPRGPLLLGGLRASATTILQILQVVPRVRVYREDGALRAWQWPLVSWCASTSKGSGAVLPDSWINLLPGVPVADQRAVPE